MLTPAQERFCLLIVQGATQAEAARKIGRNQNTTTNWAKNPEVKHRIEQLRTDTLTQALDKLRERVMRNIDIVQEIAEEGGEPGVVTSRLKAAMWAVDKVLKGADSASPVVNPALRDLAADLERSSEEELQELLSRV